MFWKTTKSRGELYISSIFLCVGILVIIGSLKMPRSMFNMPGPGFYPGIIGVIFSTASLILILQTLFKRRKAEIVQLGHLDIWSVILGLIVVALMLERIGFTFVFILFLTLILKKLSDLSWILCIAWGVLGAVAAYLLFDIVLAVRLPYLLYFQWGHI